MCGEAKIKRGLQKAARSAKMTHTETGHPHTPIHVLETYMEIYDECTICGKWDDLIRWQVLKEVSKTEDGEPIKDKVTIAYACNECHNKLDSYTMRGWNRSRALFAVMKEVSNGKK